MSRFQKVIGLVLTTKVQGKMYSYSSSKKRKLDLSHSDEGTRLDTTSQNPNELQSCSHHPQASTHKAHVEDEKSEKRSPKDSKDEEEGCVCWKKIWKVVGKIGRGYRRSFGASELSEMGAGFFEF